MESPARYFDGVRPVARSVLLRHRSDGIEIVASDGEVAGFWPFSEARIDSREPEARLHRAARGVDTGERLILASADFSAVFGGSVDAFGQGRAGEAGAGRMLAWSVTAVAAVIFLVFVGIPVLARIAAPLVPWSWEAKLGRSIEPQVLSLFGAGKPLTLCGAPGSPGKAALDAMAARLAAGASLPGPLRVDVVDTALINAFALPGGRILIFRPVIEKAAGPDEVAGVLAHEIGHVIHRDSMRAIINDSALSVVVGLVLGDITGGFSVGVLKSLVSSAYSREHESAADKVSVALMRHAGADPRAINLFFRRMSALEGKGASPLDLFNSHPVTDERIKAVEQLAADAPKEGKPILDAAEWNALGKICAEKAPAGG